MTFVAAVLMLQMGPNAWKAKGEKLLQLQRFQEASEAFSNAAAGYEKTGDPNAAKILRERSQRYYSTVELYAEEPVQPTTGAKYEPASGMYLGANIEREDATHAPAKFNELVGKKHAMYFMYRRYGEAFPYLFADELKKAGAALQIAWEPDSLDDVVDDDYLTDFGDAIKKSGIPVFLRFASEMNGSWVPYTGNPTLYKEKFRLVANRVRAIAPNAVMVWSPNAIPEKPIDDYYPGAEYVDWVGVNFYSVMYNDADRARAADWRFPTDSIDYVYNKYSPAHPIMISEWAASHRSSIDADDRPDFAEAKIREFFRTVPLKYPRLKCASWLSFNALKYARSDRQLNNYSLLDNSAVGDSYRKEIDDSYFLSQVGSTDDVRWKKVDTDLVNRPGRKLRVFFRSYDHGASIQVEDSTGSTKTFGTNVPEFEVGDSARYVDVSLLDSNGKPILKKRFSFKI